MPTPTRIAPLEAPFADDVEAQLRSMMPAGAPPIALFRTFVKNMPMTRAMSGWGSYELNRSLSVELRDREIVIDRTCARCGCEYEWGVHVAFFAAKAGFSEDQVASLTHGHAGDACWDTPRDRLLIQLVDQLHDSATIAEPLWTELSGEFSEAQLLDLTMLCGWYHAISFTARAANVAREEGAPTFASVGRN